MAPPLRVGVAAATLAAALASAIPRGLQARLEEIAKLEAEKHNCSVSLAIRNAGGQAVAAAGTVDFGSGHEANASDKYPWGSVTKMLTAASIMKLVSQGAFKLDDRVAPLVDPFIAKMASRDPNQNFTCLKDLWGERAEDLTLRQLLSMQSGIPDFDTAMPRVLGRNKDRLRVQLYETPDHNYTPPELMSEPWVDGKWKNCRTLPIPGHKPQKLCYSSTNFMLLGMVLAANAGYSSWSSFDQAAFLPPSLRGQITFANHGNPRNHGAVHGYDRTSYNLPRGEHNDHDNWEVDGVFAGWTASNIVATAASVAELAWQIFGPPEGLAPKKYIQQMVPDEGIIYGLGTFNLLFETGHKFPLGAAYGHLGATYGYQSVVAFLPALNVSLAIATNIETDVQVQPADTFCLTFNAIAGAQLNKTFTCEFSPSHYFFGGACRCEPKVVELVV